MSFRYKLNIFFTIITMQLFQAVEAGDYLNQSYRATTGKIIIDDTVIGNESSSIVSGSGKLGSENRTLANFDKIKVVGNMDIVYSRGSAVSVYITGDDNIIPIIDTEVNGKTLNISAKKSYSNQLPITLKITTPNLHVVSLNGSGNLNATNIDDSNLSLIVNGSGDATATGKVDNLDIQLLGTGNIDTRKLDAADVGVNLVGSGDIKVAAHKNLAITLIGSGDIHYFGNPNVVKNSTIGTGDVIPNE